MSAEGRDGARLDQIRAACCPSPFQVLRGAVVPLGTQSQISNRNDLSLGERATIAFAIGKRLLRISPVRSAYDLELLPTLTDRDHLWPRLVKDVGIRFDAAADDGLTLA